MDQPNIKSFLSATDPLSEEAIRFLAGYREEDAHVDYKEMFHTKDEREWLELTKDVMAFANTHGGYLVFGIKNATYKHVGVDPETTTVLLDVNTFQQKTSRFVEPPFQDVRARDLTIEGVTLVVVHVPRSKGCTHVISKNGTHKHPSGQDKVILNAGTIYIRQSAGNHLAGSRDIDALVDRRLEECKETLLERIAKVVTAPLQSEVYVVSQTQGRAIDKQVILSDDVDAIPVKGLSFTISPDTPEEEVACWVSIQKKRPDVFPPSNALWQWYRARNELRVSFEHKIALAGFCLMREVPAFFWLRGASAHDIRVLICGLLDQRLGTEITHILQVATFLGKRTYRTFLSKVKHPERSLVDHTRKFPTGNPRKPFGIDHISRIKASRFKTDEDGFRLFAENELDRIAGSVDGTKSLKPKYDDLWLAYAYDCWLYAQDDRYVSGAPSNADDDDGCDQQEENPQ